MKNIKNNIVDNKKLWFHRRLMAYLLLVSIVVAFFTLMFLFIFTSLLQAYNAQQLQSIEHITIVYFVICGVIISLYFILTTLHDQTLIPLFIGIVKSIKKK
jgi:uncharacterized BrkB/YihY/UPF0761 family membrane protein